MSYWARFKQYDYTLSQRISQYLSFDGIPRKLVQLFTLTGTSFFWIFGLILVYLTLPDLRPQAFTLIFTTLVMVIPVYIIKHTVRRPRPDFKDTRFGSTVFDEWSFPSGHASRATYIVILLSDYYPNLMIIWLIWGIMIVISRLLLGVHYLSDIVSGIIISGVLTYLLYHIDWLPITPFVNLLPR